MNKTLSTFLISAISWISATAQDQNAVVNAEFAFAGTAREYTMKKAFLQHIDSMGVVFNEGKVQNGLEYWNKAPEAKGKLLWRPVFYGMAASNDLGFTTGPWEFRQSMTDSVRGAGQYTTIWAKNAKGEWKFLVDLGVGFRQSLFGDTSGVLNACPELTSKQHKSDTTLLDLEQQFLRAFVNARQDAFQRYIHSASWLNIDGKHPLRHAAAILPVLATLPAELQFEPIAHGMSAAKDLGYVYGIIHYGTKKENYLRVWGRTQEGWKILLQVIKR